MPCKDLASQREYQRKWRKEHPQSVRSYNQKWARKDNRWSEIKKKYGLTQEAWETLFEGQGSCCAVCGSEEPSGKNWHTDHDHSTGKVRGILCRPCNLTLGHSKEDTQRLLASAAYLAAHQEISP